MNRAVIPALLLFALTAALPGKAQARTHAPDGSSRERLESIAILPKPGAPFSATVVTQWTRLLEDGSTTTVYNTRTIARDTSGRIFEERRFLTPQGNQQQPPLSALQYADPTRHEFYNCNPNTRTCLVSAYNRPASIPVSLPAGKLPSGNGTLTRENLGQRTVDSLDLQGSREILTINAGVNGYQHPEPTIKEFWYSPRLDLNVIVKRFEPRGGAQNFTLENINLNPPDPKLFLPPANYKIIRLDTQ